MNGDAQVRASTWRAPTGRSPAWSATAPLDLVPYAGALALAYAVKHFCSTAGADQLAFLLRPTAALVELATGHAFVAERGAGYFSRELSVMIAPVCSGANFLVVAFTALVLGFTARAKRPSVKLAWFFASAALAYLATLLINATRIAVSLRLADPSAGSALSGQSVHRLLGIVTYLGGLLALYAFAGRLFARRTLSALDFAVPLGVYSAVTLLTPWLRGAGARAEYWSHASVVGSVVIATAAALLARQLFRSLGRSSDGLSSRRNSSDRSERGRLRGRNQAVE